MAADVPVEHENGYAEGIKTAVSISCSLCLLQKSLLAHSELRISDTPDNFVSITFCSQPVCEAAKGEEFVALNRINVSQPVAPTSSEEVKHPPLFIPLL